MRLSPSPSRCLATLCSPLAAQRDARPADADLHGLRRPISTALRLWTVADQPVPDASSIVPLIDHFASSRRREADDRRRLLRHLLQGQAPRDHGRGVPAGPGLRRQLQARRRRRSRRLNVERCNSIDDAGALGGRRGARRPASIYRIASDEFISPFVRGDGRIPDQQPEPAARRRRSNRTPPRSSSTTTTTSGPGSGRRSRSASARPSRPARATSSAGRSATTSSGIQAVTGAAVRPRRGARRTRPCTSTSSA